MEVIANLISITCFPKIVPTINELHSKSFFKLSPTFCRRWRLLTQRVHETGSTLLRAVAAFDGGADNWHAVIGRGWVWRRRMRLFRVAATGAVLAAGRRGAVGVRGAVAAAQLVHDSRLCHQLCTDTNMASNDPRWYLCSLLSLLVWQKQIEMRTDATSPRSMSSIGDAGEVFSFGGELLELVEDLFLSLLLLVFICWLRRLVCCSKRDWILLLPSALPYRVQIK